MRIIKGKLCVDAEWLRQFYAHPPAAAAKNKWGCPEKGWYVYADVYASALNAKREKKSLPLESDLIAQIKSVPKKKEVKSRIANKNAEKMQSWHKKILNALYKDANGYSSEYIYKMYSSVVSKTLCQYLQAGKINKNNIVIQDIIDSSGELIFKVGDRLNEALSMRSIQRYLASDKVKMVFDGQRKGRKFNYDTYVPTEKPKYVHSIWAMDGYTNNFYINNTFKTCVTYVIIDVATETIIAAVTGKAGEKENHQLQLAAWQKAIETAGCLPNEVEADGLNCLEYIYGAGITLLHSNRRKSHGAFIEQYFGRMQAAHFQDKVGYRGNNILSKKESRMNSDINPTNAAQYPCITVDMIQGEWDKLQENSKLNANGFLFAGQKIEQHQIAYLFGRSNQITIKNAFVKVGGDLFEVHETLLLSEKMPNDFYISIYRLNDSDTAYIFNKSLFLGEVKKTVRVQRSRAENDKPEVLGHHIQRAESLQKAIEKKANELSDLPEDIQTLVDLARSPSYWNKEKERSIDEAIAKVSASKKPKKGMFDADESDFKIEKIA